MKPLLFALLAAFPGAAIAQIPEPLDVMGKLRLHTENTVGPLALVGIAAYAGALQEFDAPLEWRQGGASYAKRVASTAGAWGINGALAFSLDSALHQDPRYYRSLGTGFWPRAAHALRETVLTHTDAGEETLSTWRIGSAYGSAFLSNQWYPDRLNTARLGLIQGSVGMGFGLISNLATEFWPDVRRKVLRKK